MEDIIHIRLGQERTVTISDNGLTCLSQPIGTYNSVPKNVHLRRIYTKDSTVSHPDLCLVTGTCATKLTQISFQRYCNLTIVDECPDSLSGIRYEFAL